MAKRLALGFSKLVLGRSGGAFAIHKSGSLYLLSLYLLSLYLLSLYLLSLYLLSLYLLVGMLVGRWEETPPNTALSWYVLRTS